MKRHMNMLLSDMMRTRRYIFIAVVLFIVSVWLGYYWQVFHVFLDEQVKGVAGIAEEIANAPNPLLALVTFIFINNALKSVLVVFLGFFLGVFPVIFLCINGMVLGYLYLDMVVANAEITTWQMILAIMPHGIIELPILIIACGFGLRFGAIVWARIIGLKSSERGSIVAFLKQTPRLIVFITLGMLVAALIESFITPWLIGVSL